MQAQRDRDAKRRLCPIFREKKSAANLKRMENPEYRERKREIDRLRLENKEVRDRKRAIDRQRRKLPEFVYRDLETSKRFRQTAKYKEWARIRQNQISEKNRKEWILNNLGKSCGITFVNCVCCSKHIVKRSIIVGVSIVKSTHCNDCAKGKRIPRTVDVICSDCGVVCQGNRARKVCDSCAKVRFKDRKRNSPKEVARKKDRGSSMRGRARRYGAYIDKVSIKTVHDRDRWKCVCCGIKVVKSKHWQPNQATIDHRIPLSRGGSHTYENCQTMCMMCNSKKEATMPTGVQLSVFDMVR